MPVVIVEILEGRTIEQKKELAKAITNAVAKICKVSSEIVTIIYHEVPKTNWAAAGILHSEAEK